MDGGVVVLMATIYFIFDSSEKKNKRTRKRRVEIGKIFEVTITSFWSSTEDKRREIPHCDLKLEGNYVQRAVGRGGGEKLLINPD